MIIRLQIASIEVYVIGFFFCVRSAFKGRIQSNLATIRDQSRLNWITTESRMRGSRRTQDFAQKLLNLFTIQSRVEVYKEEHYFYRKNHGPSDSVKTDEWLRLRDFDAPRSHDLLISPPVRSPSKRLDASTCLPKMSRIRD